MNLKKTEKLTNQTFSKKDKIYNFTKKIYTILKFIFYHKISLKNLHLENNNKSEKNLSNEIDEKIIKKIIFSFKQIKKQKIENEVYKPLGAWRTHIEKFKINYIELIQKEDIEGLRFLFKNFLRNNSVRGIWIYTFFNDVKNSSFIHKIKLIINILEDYERLNKLVKIKKIEDLNFPNVGNPWGYKFKKTTLLPTSCSHYYYAHKLKNIAKNIENPIFCEIGGGFGGSAYYLLKDNKNYTYINFDIPEVLIICEYFLMKSFKNRKILLFDEKIDSLNFETVSKYDIILMPNFMLPKLEKNLIDVTFNTRSLSEMNRATINEYVNQIQKFTKTYFYHDNSDVAIVQRDQHREIKTSDFNLEQRGFKLISSNKNFLGGGTRFRFKEYLYKK